MADAFFVAFKLPNFFRRLFAEGAFNAAFVPLFARHMSEGGVMLPVDLRRKCCPSSWWRCCCS